MASLDPNQWYEIVVQANSAVSLKGTSLFNNGSTGAVFFTSKNASSIPQQWQFFPYGDYYLLRSHDSGPHGYLGCKAGNSTNPAPVPQMANQTLSDDTSFWLIEAWSQGGNTYSMSNKENGTHWNFSYLSTGLVALSSDTTPQSAEALSFNTVGAINDVNYSRLQLPEGTSTISLSATTSSPATTSATTTSTSLGVSSNPTNESKKGSGSLSTGASAVIGGLIALTFVLALVGGFLYWKRRRARQQADNTDSSALLGTDPTPYMGASSMESYRDPEADVNAVKMQPTYYSAPPVQQPAYVPPNLNLSLNRSETQPHMPAPAELHAGKHTLSVELPGSRGRQ